MSALVNFLQNADFADGDVFTGHMCVAAGGAPCHRATRLLMGTCTRARRSPVVLALLEFIARRARARRDLAPMIAATRLLLAVRDESAEAAEVYMHALQALPACIPPLCAYSSLCAGHAIVRSHALRSGLFRRLFALVGEQASRPVERAHVRQNMQAAVICMHKCIVHFGDRLCLVSEHAAFAPDMLAGISRGLVDKYTVLTHDINVEYIAVGVLECVCGYRFDGAVFEHLLSRFCDCVAEGHELMTLFVHHSLLRLLARGELRAAVGAHLRANRSLDYLVTRVYSSPDVSRDAHAAVASVAAEMLGCAGEVDDDCFGRLEQLAALAAEPPHGQCVLECYAQLLARAVLCYAGEMAPTDANRVIATLCDLGVRAFAPASPAQTHLCEAVHCLALVRRSPVLPGTWERILALAVQQCALSPPEISARVLGLFLHALREVPQAAVRAVMERAQLLSAVLRDREFVADRPACVVLVLKIVQVLAARLARENLAEAQEAVAALDLGDSLRQLCRACAEVVRVYRSAAGRSLMLFLARVLLALADARVLHRGTLRALALGLLAHGLRHAGRGAQYSLRMHRVARLWLAQMTTGASLPAETLDDFVEAATGNGATHRAVRVSTLCLLRLLLSRGCAQGHPAACQAMLMYCVRALLVREAEPGGYDLPTYLTAQRILHVIVTAPAHAASGVDLQPEVLQQLQRGLDARRHGMQTLLRCKREAAALDASILQQLHAKGP